MNRYLHEPFNTRSVDALLRHVYAALCQDEFVPWHVIVIDFCHSYPQVPALVVHQQWATISDQLRRDNLRPFSRRVTMPVVRRLQASPSVATMPAPPATPKVSSCCDLPDLMSAPHCAIL